MTTRERVAENLNLALHNLFTSDDRVHLIGEDVADPYGGAFKISKGLSSKFPDRVISTPISESAIAGVASGLALAGEKAIMEVMFGDFVGLCFDMIYNFAAKSVTMYGHRVPMPLIVRCPVGGGRGYGPTHSQSPQKHFIGIPNLTLRELSPLHDNTTILRRMLATGEPSILFEDKILYGQRVYHDGTAGDIFGFDYLDDDHEYARVHADGDHRSDCLVIAAGGMFHRALAAAERLLIEDEISCQIVVPSRLSPFDLAPLNDLLTGTRLICILEEGIGGGTWGADVACDIYRRMWGRLPRPVCLVSSAPSIIPTAPHLERDVLVQSDTIYRRIRDALHE